MFNRVNMRKLRSFDDFKFHLHVMRDSGLSFEFIFSFFLYLSFYIFLCHFISIKVSFVITFTRLRHRNDTRIDKLLSQNIRCRYLRARGFSFFFFLFFLFVAKSRLKHIPRRVCNKIVKYGTNISENV